MKGRAALYRSQVLFMRAMLGHECTVRSVLQKQNDLHAPNADAQVLRAYHRSQMMCYQVLRALYRL
jgi:hypothetical protein